MTVREFGQQHTKHLLFFPGSCEPWQEFAYAAKELAARYHVLLVTPDGHDPDEHTDFISVEKTVDDTVRWLKEHRIDRLDALYGLSFGGGMVVCFLTTQDIPADRVIIDAGTAPYRFPKWICKLICVRDYVMFKIGRASLAAMESAFPPSDLQEIGKTQRRNIGRYSDTSGLSAIVLSGISFGLPTITPFLRSPRRSCPGSSFGWAARNGKDDTGI